jgi:hypothetical protein
MAAFAQRVALRLLVDEFVSLCDCVIGESDERVVRVTHIGAVSLMGFLMRPDHSGYLAERWPSGRSSSPAAG